MSLAYTRGVSITPSGNIVFRNIPQITCSIVRQNQNIIENLVHYEDENQDIALRVATCWFVGFSGSGKQIFDIIRSIENFSNLKYDENCQKNWNRILVKVLELILFGPLQIVIKDDLLDKNKKLQADGIGKISQDLIDQIR